MCSEQTWSCWGVLNGGRGDLTQFPKSWLMLFRGRKTTAGQWWEWRETTATDEASDGSSSAWGSGNQIGELCPVSCLGYFLELDAKQFVDNWNWGWERKEGVNNGTKVSRTVQLEGNRRFLRWNRKNGFWEKIEVLHRMVEGYYAKCIRHPLAFKQGGRI